MELILVTDTPLRGSDMPSPNMTSSQFKLEQDYSWFYHSNMLAFANFGIYNDGETDTEGADDISKNRKIDCVEILMNQR